MAGRPAGGELVELVLGRELGFDDSAAGGFARRQKLRQAMVGLGAEDEVDGASAAHDFLAFRLGDAAGNGDDHLPPRGCAVLLHAADLSQFGIDLLGRLLADVAGVEDDQVGLFGPIGLGIAQGCKHIAHALAVIDIHLAAVGLDEDLLGEGVHGGQLLTHFGRMVKRAYQAGAHLGLGMGGQMPCGSFRPRATGPRGR